MANKINWEVESVASVITTTELDNKADGATILGPSDYANATNKYRWADFLFFGTFDAACDAGATVELHLFYKLDASKYGDGEDGDLGGVVASGNSLHGIFVLGAVADAYQQILGVRLSPFDFRAAVKLNTGQDLTDSASHFLEICPYNEEIQ